MAPQTKKETYLLWDVKAILDDFEGPNDEMIQKAKIYEEDDRVGPCTDLEHNDNCGIRIGPKLLEYYWLRRSGLINQKPLEQWGCEPVRDKNEKIVASAFRDIDWNGGFTGRGSGISPPFFPFTNILICEQCPKRVPSGQRR